VVGKEIAGLTRMNNDIGFRYRSSFGTAGVVQRKLFKIFFYKHGRQQQNG
jgi:hypothetical protein